MDLAQYWFQQPPATGGTGNSLRFRGAQNLSRTVPAAGNMRLHTLSVWLKKTSTGSTNSIFSARSGVTFTNNCAYYFEGVTYGDAIGFSGNVTGTTLRYRVETAARRDPSAWMHCVYVLDTNNATESERFRHYVNGQRVTQHQVTSPIPVNNFWWNVANAPHAIGSNISNGYLQYFEGYMSAVHFVDGQALEPTEFGESNDDGVWVPKTVSIDDYGTNGFYLDFSDPDDIGADRSGNGNDWTANGFELTDTTSVYYDWMEDSPTQNYATINPLYPGASTSNANLTTANTTGKPTILGVAGNGWDGTEAGWTTTGDVDFGQRTAADEISTRTIDAVTITNPSDHFEVITDTGANILTAAQAKFPNGLWWIKDRANTNQHQFVDSVRGSLALTCPEVAFEQPYVAPAGNSVAWGWSTDTNGLNQTAGFEIIQYTGNASNQTLTHQLGKAPDMVFIKNQSNNATQPTSRLWHVYHSGVATPQGNYAILNSNSAFSANSVIWQNKLPTDTEFYLGNTSGGNTSGVDYVAYMWTTVPGYSAFGSYTGNGSTTGDGPFIYTGFKPALLLVKRSVGGVGSWHICDSTRDTYNPSDHVLYSDTNWSESVVTGNEIDLLSNGFKCRGSDTLTNASGSTYIYAAFAEHPFGGSNVSPTTAR